MTASIRERICETVVTKLETIATTFRDRQSAVARAEGAVILVQEKIETVENRNNGVAIRDLTVEISLLYRSDAPSQATDGTVQGMHQILTSDQTLGGLANRIIEEGTEWRYDEADLTAVEVALQYRIRYMTPVGVLNVIA